MGCSYSHPSHKCVKMLPIKLDRLGTKKPDKSKLMENFMDLVRQGGVPVA